MTKRKQVFTNVSRHRSGEGYQRISAALMVPKNTVASIILKWKKFGTTKTLSRSGCLANWGRRTLIREVTKKPMVTLTEFQSTSVELVVFWKVLPSLQHSTDQAFMVEWPDRSHSSVKGT
jgi:hypothetical protein